jgi:hypothetical protein
VSCGPFLNSIASDDRPHPLFNRNFHDSFSSWDASEFKNGAYDTQRFRTSLRPHAGHKMSDTYPRTRLFLPSSPATKKEVVPSCSGNVHLSPPRVYRSHCNHSVAAALYLPEGPAIHPQNFGWDIVSFRDLRRLSRLLLPFGWIVLQQFRHGLVQVFNVLFVVCAGSIVAPGA